MNLYHRKCSTLAANILKLHTRHDKSGPPHSSGTLRNSTLFEKFPLEKACPTLDAWGAGFASVKWAV